MLYIAFPFAPTHGAVVAGMDIVGADELPWIRRRCRKATSAPRTPSTRCIGTTKHGRALVAIRENAQIAHLSRQSEVIVQRGRTGPRQSHAVIQCQHVGQVRQFAGLRVVSSGPLGISNRPEYGAGITTPRFLSH